MGTLLMLAGYSKTGSSSIYQTHKNKPFIYPSNSHWKDETKFLVDYFPSYKHIVTDPILVRKTIEQYVDDYADLLDQEENRGKVAVDFTTVNNLIDPEALARLAEYSKGRLDIKVLLTLRHPVDRLNAIYCKLSDYLIEDNAPLNMNPYMLLQGQIKYEDTYNLFRQHFPILVMDGLHYLKTFYRKKELSDLIGYELSSDPIVWSRITGKRMKENVQDGMINPESEEGSIKNDWTEIVCAKYCSAYQEDIETWKRLCF